MRKQLFVVIYAIEVIRELMDVLPSTDLIGEIKSLLDIQYGIAMNYFEDVDSGEENVSVFLDYLKEVMSQAKHLKEVSDA